MKRAHGPPRLLDGRAKKLVCGLIHSAVLGPVCVCGRVLWEMLRGQAVSQLQLSNLASDFESAQAPMGDHLLFLVDSRGSGSATPACGQESKQGGRQELLAPVESAGRARVKAELSELEAGQTRSASISQAGQPSQL